MEQDGGDSELVHRSPAEVAQRCLGLLAIIERSYEKDASALWDRAERQGIPKYLTAAEVEFFRSPDPPQDSRNAFSWRAEALVPLLWALQQLPEMPPLNERVDLSSCLAVHSALTDPAMFISSAVLRPAEELDAAEADLFHEHWRVRDAQLFQNSTPAELDPDVVYERRYGLSWLVGWGIDWDDVPTDT